MKADKPTKLKSDCKRSTLDGVPYSTEFCRRRRLEVQTLQVEAETLAAQLSELQANGAAAPACQCPSTASSTQWRSAAVVERGKRKCAEEINRRLKATLEELTKLHASFLRALNKPQTLKDLDFMAQMEPKIDRPPSQRRFSDTVLEEMCNNSFSTTTDSKVTADLQNKVVAGERNLIRHFSATQKSEEERAFSAWTTEGLANWAKSSKAAWTDEQLEQLVKKGTSADEAFKLFQFDEGVGKLLSASNLKRWETYVGMLNNQNPEKQVSLIKNFTKAYGDEAVAKLLYTAKSKWWTKDVASEWQAALFKQWIHEKKNPDDVYRLLGLMWHNAYTDPFNKMWWEYVDAYAKAVSKAKI
ncbi:hypothetical protein PR002_g7964 [Phytophthora rubi]|uniref:RxLR effector protein n=1 Tax=Phytophthora rubi TaxID=129364 RepID=A0A6A3MZH5_9STRA|nr:hypothetical protein PR002_g7964 [Phytophthora rubi]